MRASQQSATLEAELAAAQRRIRHLIDLYSEKQDDDAVDDLIGIDHYLRMLTAESLGGRRGSRQLAGQLTLEEQLANSRVPTRFRVT